MTGYPAMKSQGSFAEATKRPTKEELAREAAARATRSTERRQHALRWVSEHFPETNTDAMARRGWPAILAMCAMTVRHLTGSCDRESVLARARHENFPVDELGGAREVA